MFEKEAEEYVCGLFPSVNVFASGRLIQAFKDGAKFGYNKVNEWHDLRKNPNDLPPYDKSTSSCIDVLSDEGFVCFYSDIDKCWYRHGCHISPPKAWCKIPKFEEVKSC